MKSSVLAVSLVPLVTIAVSGCQFDPLPPITPVDGGVDGAPVDSPVGTSPITIEKSGTGSMYGTVRAVGIECGTDCVESVETGTMITLSASASPNQATFVGWSGEGVTCQGTGDCTLTVSAATTVTATFAIANHAVTVTKAGNGMGAGRVTSMPMGIDCGTDCTEDYAYASMVTLTASAPTGATFTGWSDGCTGTGACVIQVDGAKAATANFTLDPYTLGVTRAGTGAAYGRVVSNINGIDCGTDCSETYTNGQMVTLTASVPTAAAATFAGWSGGGCMGTGTCTVTVSQALNVTAAFNIRQYTLTVTRSGSGAANGSVVSDPTGVSCAPDCSESYDYGQEVVLTASANGAMFTGWSGSGCSGTGTCMVTMTAARSVDAAFAINQHTLTVQKNGFGSGTVTGTGINCGVDCMETVNENAVVTLTASPTGSDIFYGWSGGGCSGTGTCMVTVAAATTVTATFDQCTRSTQTCSLGNFTQCDANGAFVSYLVPNGADGAPATLVMNSYACPLGCLSGGNRCLDVSATNGLNAALDSMSTSATGLDVSLAQTGTTIIDTSLFDAIAGTTVITQPNGTTLTVPAVEIVQTGAPAILVLKVRSFTIGSNAYVAVRGARALGIASHFDVYIAGQLDLSGNTTNGGVGESTNSACAGAGSSNATAGGGNWTGGGSSSTSASGGLPLPVTSLSPLEGGCRSGGITPAGAGRPVGMAAGGAVQIVSRTKLNLASTGIINVSGRRGFGSVNSTSGAVYALGGSAGGGVLVEAPVVTFAPGSTVAGRGGSGAAANISTSTTATGTDGTLTGTTVAGATCTGCGRGGDGGTESTSASSGTGTSPAVGGGGGAVGRCYARNRTGSLSPAAGIMKIYFQALAIGTR